MANGVTIQKNIALKKAGSPRQHFLSAGKFALPEALPDFKRLARLCLAVSDLSCLAGHQQVKRVFPAGKQAMKKGGLFFFYQNNL